MTEEIWKPFPTDSRYEISNKGKVRNKNNGNILKPSNGGKGYELFVRYRNGEYSGMFIHQAVALAFIGERPQGYQVSHLDGDKLNNSVDNLTYELPLDNIGRKVEHGTHPIGDKNSQSKLTAEQVLTMREYAVNNKVTNKELGIMFGVSPMTANRAIRKISWSNI
ncbi:MAG: NUMOD4 motif-containing HNH endonuclease [Erysipelotrichaceae bacterium]